MNKSKFSLESDDIENDRDNDYPEIDRKALEEFAQGAATHSTKTLAKQEPSDDDWRNEDPDAMPSYNFRLRLNKYEIGLLKHAAGLERRSLSNMIKLVLVQELSKKLEK